jgi:hypothetical protein
MSIKKLVDLTCQHKYCAPCFTARQHRNAEREFFPAKVLSPNNTNKADQPHVPTDVKDLSN